MKVLQRFLTALFCVVVSSSYVDAGCTVGMYYDHGTKSCVPCSLCPTNKIILRQCFNDVDTLCGTWKIDLNQTPFRQDAVDVVTSKHVESVDNGMDAYQPTKQVQLTLQEEVAELDDKWFTITMVLVGFLVFACVTGLILVFYICIVCRRKQREIVCDSVYTSALLRDDTQTPPKFEPFRIISQT